VVIKPVTPSKVGNLLDLKSPGTKSICANLLEFLVNPLKISRTVIVGIFLVLQLSSSSLAFDARNPADLSEARARLTAVRAIKYLKLKDQRISSYLSWRFQINNPGPNSVITRLGVLLKDFVPTHYPEVLRDQKSITVAIKVKEDVVELRFEEDDRIADITIKPNSKYEKPIKFTPITSYETEQANLTPSSREDLDALSKVGTKYFRNEQIEFLASTRLSGGKKVVAWPTDPAFSKSPSINALVGTDVKSGTFVFAGASNAANSTLAPGTNLTIIEKTTDTNASDQIELPEIGRFTRESKGYSSSYVSAGKQVQTGEMVSEATGEIYRLYWLRDTKQLGDKIEIFWVVVGFPSVNQNGFMPFLYVIFPSLQLRSNQISAQDQPISDLANWLGPYESKSLSWRRLATGLVKAGRLNEARIALEVTKEEEHLAFTKRISKKPVKPLSTRASDGGKVRFQNASWNSGNECGPDYESLRENLSVLALEANKLTSKAERTPEEDKRLFYLRGQLSCAGAEYQKILLSLFESTENSEEKVSKYHRIPKLRAMMSQLREIGQENGSPALVYTLVTKEEYWVLLVTPDVILARQRPMDVPAVEREIKEFRVALQNPRLDPISHARELYRQLFEPIAVDVEKLGIQTLVWSLDQKLRYLPVAALHDGNQYLVQKYANVLYTPAAVSRWTDLPPAVGGAGFGVSKATPPLPYVATELYGIFGGPATKTRPLLPGSVYINEAFSRQNLRNEIVKASPKGFRALHIASHFVLNPGDDSKFQSYLLFGGDDHFTIQDLDNSFNYFDGVHLLVLSACNTAVTDPRNQTEGTGREIESFGVLAQEQGAKSVLATLWAVNDPATSKLMQNFYQTWSSPLLLTKAQALQRSQISMINGTLKPDKGIIPCRPESGLSTIDKSIAYTCDPEAPFAHPFYWSPFILIGNWR